MNNNFTHRKFKALESGISGFFRFLPGLPAITGGAVNFLFSFPGNLTWLSIVSKKLKGHQAALKPVLVVNRLSGYKKIAQ